MSGQNTRLPVAGRKHHAQKTKTKAGNKEKKFLQNGIIILSFRPKSI